MPRKSKRLEEAIVSVEEVSPELLDKTPKKEVSLILKEGEFMHDLVGEITEVEDLRNVVCPFYKNGRAVKCIGCKKEDDIVEGCKEELIAGLLRRPTYGLSGAFYDTAFDLPIVLPRVAKVSVLDTVAMGLICNTCHVSDNCPLYVENHECGIDWKEGVDTTDTKAVLGHMIDLQMQRVTRARNMELIDGGMPDQTTSGEMDRLTGLIGMKDNLDADRFSVRIDASSKSGSEGGGILAKLFGGGGSGSNTENLPELEAKTIDFEELEVKPATKDKRKKDE
jgi:hypothetical protein